MKTNIQFFAGVPSIKMVFDDSVTNITATDYMGGEHSWKVSGETFNVEFTPFGDPVIFNVTLKEGYELKSVSSAKNVTKNSFNLFLDDLSSSSLNTITITTKKAAPKTKDVTLTDGDIQLFPQTKASLLLNDDGSPYTPVGGAGDKATVVGNKLSFEQAVESKVVVANNNEPTTENLTKLKVGEKNYAIPQPALPTEAWTFTLEDGSVVTKNVVVK